MGLERERKLMCNLIRSKNALLTLFVVPSHNVLVLWAHLICKSSPGNVSGHLQLIPAEIMKNFNHGR